MLLARVVRFAFAAMLLAAPVGARADGPDEDHRQVCPLVSPALAAAAAAAVEGQGACKVHCEGCGCKGGPGYRGSRGCVSWKTLIRECGPPPHSRCRRECAIVSPGCAAGRVWLKALAAGAGLALSFAVPTPAEGGGGPAPEPPTE